MIGILAGVLAYYISVFCFRHNVPGTTVNIASGGLGGLVGEFLRQLHACKREEEGEKRDHHQPVEMLDRRGP